MAEEHRIENDGHPTLDFLRQGMKTKAIGNPNFMLNSINKSDKNFSFFFFRDKERVVYDNMYIDAYYYCYYYCCYY
jgi:hypothetical protein